jgi:hypothetical protein
MSRSSQDGAVQSRPPSRAGKVGAEIINYNPDGSVKSKSRLQSFLDAHGNLIRQIMSESVDGTDNFRVVSVQYVTIEYYGND